MTGLGWMDYVIVALGAVSLVVWLIFYFKGKKYNQMFDVLEEKEYPLKEIYGFGYAVLETIKYGYKTKADRKLRQDLEVLNGEKYCEYYLRVIHAQKITIFSLIFVLAFALYGLTAEFLALVVGIGFAFLAYYYYGTIAKKKIEKRSEELLHDFSEVVSKLALLTNAGMILREAWQEVAAGGEGVIYDEMRLAVDDERVIIRTKLEKPSKIKGLALI